MILDNKNFEYGLVFKINRYDSSIGLAFLPINGNLLTINTENDKEF